LLYHESHRSGGCDAGGCLQILHPVHVVGFPVRGYGDGVPADRALVTEFDAKIDVEEQRIILSEILKKLGYRVSAMSSGEEAIEYMKENSADLLVLDMIMDPGINGLGTYKRILKSHPNQKAIIASGFSETEHVKETLRLGAGAYIKKPYSFEEIGRIIKDELDG